MRSCMIKANITAFATLRVLKDDNGEIVDILDVDDVQEVEIEEEVYELYDMKFHFYKLN